ncbi:hypothetical protein [Actinokineospora sp. NPDC004072]
MTQELDLVPIPRSPSDEDVDLIGGRAATWTVPAPPEDEDYEPTIIRGRE